MTNEKDQSNLGLIQVYTGDGKGKTTAALGLAFRAAGNQMKTYIGQFLKGREYGELDSARHLDPLIIIEQYGLNGWVHVDNVTPEQRHAALTGLERAREIMQSGEYHIVVLDEINVALYFGVLLEKEVLGLIDEKPEHVELVLTGRKAPASIIDKADLVTEMKEIRHPFNRGVPARRGIEF